MCRVLVYGTLRKGESNHHYIQEAEILDRSVEVSGYELRDYLHLYPFAFFSPGKRIIADLYDVSEELLLGPLDELEDTVNGYYIRHFDHNHQAFIYLKGKDDRQNYPLILGGDWVKYRRSLAH